VTSARFGGSIVARLRPKPDPSTSDDPVVRNLLHGLAMLGAAPALAPAETFRAELRQQLVAVTPRLVSEESGGESVPATRHRSASLWSSLRRPALILLSTAAVFLALLGGAVYLSGRALPGDPLYGVKRASEDVQLSLTSGDTARGKEYLSLAGARADEASDLLGRAGALSGGGHAAAAGINQHTAKLVSSTLEAADGRTRDGASLLNTEAARTATSAPLTDLLSWAPEQRERLQSIADRIPPGPLHARVAASVAVLDAAANRASILLPLLASRCPAGASADAYGPSPAASCQGAASTAAASVSSPVNPPSSGVTFPPPSRPSSTMGPTTGPPTGPSGAPTAAAGTPTGTLPGLPLPSPDLTSGPITTDTCGLNVNLPPIGVNVGSCGITVTIGH